MSPYDAELNEREIARLLKRVDRMVPLEESEQRLLKSSKRAAYGRAAVALLWIAVFSSLWAFLYYNMLAASSDSMSYILPRLSLSVGLWVSILYLRNTDRLKLRWAVVGGIMVFVISRAIM